MTENQIRAQELQWIVQDGWDLRQLSSSIGSHAQSGTLGLVVLPYLCFYAVESFDWLFRSQIPKDVGFFAERNADLRRIRANLKLFDTDRGGLNGMVERFSAIEKHSINWFNFHHQGFFKLIKKRFQTDLGFYFANDILICTTHVGVINAGLNPANFDPKIIDIFGKMGKEMYEFGIDIGIYLRTITEILEPFCEGKIERIQIENQTDDLKFMAEDFKSYEVYLKLSKRIGIQDQDTQYAAVITWMISQVNFIHLILKKILPKTSDVYFRMSFLTVFHALNGLIKISTVFRHKRNALIVTTANEIISAKSSRILRKLDQLRDASAHYYLRDSKDKSRVYGNTLRESTAQFSRYEIEELDALIEDCLTRMSAVFGQLIPARSLNAGWGNVHSL